jgi:hypothetical protein
MLVSCDNGYSSLGAYNVRARVELSDTYVDSGSVVTEAVQAWPGRL